MVPVESKQEIARVAVVGAGIMGSGIAQLAAMAGYDVTLCDTAPEQLERARGQIGASIEKLVGKGRLDREAGEQAVRRVQLSGSLAEAAAGAALVIEAVIEVLAVKQSILREAMAVARPDALYGTNTSQLSITAIASASPGAADRVVGLHFFNPVVLMRLVEVVRGLQTSDSTVAAAQQFAQRLGKETVVCEKDSPGFLTSRISAIVRLECLRMLEEGVGASEDIDRALRLGLNFPIGPLELGDRNGLDTFLLVLESLSETLGERFRPTVGLRNLVAAGRLGFKTGHGIYEYDERGAIRPQSPS
jgi:3-hydroxybutyryl-CoA dehydrogenase